MQFHCRVWWNESNATVMENPPPGVTDAAQAALESAEVPELRWQNNVRRRKPPTF
jgi:hypothetical protein